MSAVEETDEIKNLKLLNSFLIKELNQFKTENLKLKKENETLKSEHKELKDKNIKLMAENILIPKSDHRNKNKFDSQTEILFKEENSKTDTIIENKLSDQADMMLEKMKARIKDNQIKCNVCNKNYTSPQTLLLHKNTIHEGRKNYKCESCGDYFTELEYLKLHIKTIHEGHRSYKCDSCGKSFTQSGTLIRHICFKCNAIQEERYKCDHCGNSFIEPASLFFHIKTIHEGHRSYKCDFCGKSFIQSGALKRHIKAIHKEYYKCDSCGNTFNESGSLKLHIKTQVCKDYSTSYEHFKRKKLGLQIIGECNYCKKDYKYTSVKSMIKNMKSHLKLEHGIIEDVDNSLRKINKVENSNFVDPPSKKFKSIVWKHFKRNEQGGNAKCNQCDKMIATKKGCTTKLRDHLRGHGIEVEYKPNLNSSVWKHFEAKRKKLGLFVGECKYCKKNINSNTLKSHLKLEHGIDDS